MPGFTRARRPPAALARLPALASLLAAGALAALAAPANAQPTPVPAPPQVIDGPSLAIAGPGALHSSIARDGTGGIVYLKQAGGVAHVFLSALEGGSFLAPVQLDADLPGPSSDPVVAAGNGGVLIVAFTNGGGLYVAQRSGAGAAFGAPQLLAPAAASPSLQMTNFGKAYIAFTAPDGSGTDVRTAYYYNGRWALEPTPLNATAGDDAGSGSGRPAVAAAGDGVAIVAWGEGGHILTRRVWGTSPSVVYEQADGALPGCSEVSADEPAIGSGGDSSYAAVAFHETLTCNGQTQSRALENRLHGSRYDGLVAADGLPAGGAGGGGAGGAGQPAVAAGEYGRGWVTSVPNGSFDVMALPLASNESAGAPQQLNSLPDAGPPAPAPAIAGFSDAFIAWQHVPAAGATPDIRMRFGAGATLGPETVLSAGLGGSPDAGSGLTAAGDVSGDGAVAWVQSTAAGNEIVADQLYQAPGAPSALRPSGYIRSTRPKLVWAPSAEAWAARYTVALDGATLGQTAGTSMALSAPLAQGPHSWRVSASNAAGLTSGVRTARFFVDTIAPRVRLRLIGRRRAGTLLRLQIIDTDVPAGLPASDASGIARTLIGWGDRTARVSARHWREHVYRRPGRYRITVTVSDRAGNVRRVTIVVVVHGKPRPHRKG